MTFLKGKKKYKTLCRSFGDARVPIEQKKLPATRNVR